MLTLRCKLALTLLTGLWVVGCNGPVQPIPLQTSDATGILDYQDLAFVLNASIAEDGSLIPKALERCAARLDAQLKEMAVAGPKSNPQQFPSEEKQIAYWYNARTAWSMKLAMLCNCPKELRHRQLFEQSFPLDGREMTLSQIDQILSEYDDWRVLVAAPGVVLCRSRLPAEPFRPQDIHEKIIKRFNEFVDDPKRLTIDVSCRHVRVPPVLWQVRQRVIDQYEQTYSTEEATLITAMLPHVEGSAERRLQDVLGYRCVPSRSTLLTALFEED